MEHEEVREYRYVHDIGEQVLHWLLLLFVAPCFAAFGTRPGQIPWGAIAVALGFSNALIRRALTVRFGSVRTTDHGITARSWLGRERSLLWSEIVELRVRTAWGSGSWFHTLKLRSARREARLRIDPGLADADALTDEIVARAALTEHQRTRFANLTYRRADVATDAAA